MKTFVLADLHGGFKALLQCFEKANFDYQNDKLIFLGDVADGFSQTYECLDELMKIENLVFVRGNHDQWLKQWLDKGDQPRIWTHQGGQNTLLSYSTRLKRDKKRHLDFLKSAKHYYLDEKNRLFVHGGIDLTLPIEKQDKMTLMWDRSFWENKNQRFSIEPYSEIYVGHTSVWRESKVPVTYNKITFCDTGGGYEGKLSLLNIDTKEVFQSDMVRHLYAVETFLDLWRDL